MNNLALPAAPRNPNARALARRESQGSFRSTTAILLSALLLRLLIVWLVLSRFPPGWFFTHGLELGILARSIESGGGLSSPFGGATGPTALLGPGYPAFIALIFHLFNPLTPASATAVMVLQTLFSTATVLAILRVGERLFGGGAARISAAFWAVSLPLIWMPTIFWETCLSALLLVSMVGLSLHCARSTNLPLWALAGAFAGIASLINPALLFSLLTLIAWATWKAPRPLRSALVAILVFAAVFAPWPLRNLRVLHAFIPLRSTIGLELWMGNREGANGFLDESVFPLFNRGEYQQYVALGEVRYMRNKTALAITYIRSHPGLSLRRTLVRTVRFWAGTGTQHGSFVYPIHALLTSALGAVGLLRVIRERRLRLAMLFVLPLLLFPVPYYLTHAEFRYRLVIDPLLTILAGYAVSRRDEAQVQPAPRAEFA